MIALSRWKEILEKAGALTRSCAKGELVFLQGDACEAVGYLAAGALEIRSTTPDGRELQIQTVTAGDFFGDVLTFAGGTKYLGNVVASSAATVLLIDSAAFLDVLATHRDALSDYLGLLARKTFHIKQQVKLLSLPDLRSKILFWLRWRLGDAPRGCVAIPGSKERLASLLAVERPSLSRELAHMKTAGFIDYDRFQIELH